MMFFSLRGSSCKQIDATIFPHIISTQDQEEDREECGFDDIKDWMPDTNTRSEEKTII